MAGENEKRANLSEYSLTQFQRTLFMFSILRIDSGVPAVANEYNTYIFPKYVLVWNKIKMAPEIK